MNKERKSGKAWVERVRCSYEFHGRASLLRLLKTVEMLVPAEKEAGGEGKKGRTEGRNGARSKERRRKKKGKECESWRVEGGRWRIEPILAQGTRVKYRRTGKLLPDVKFRPGANFAART